MQNKITVSDACQQLGIARSTFERHIKRLGITTTQEGLDKRERYITLVELNQLQDNTLHVKHICNVSALEARIEALENELAILKRSLGK